MVKKTTESTPAKRKMEQTEPCTPSDAPRRTYKIGGISVEFPYKPYGSQLAYMGKVVATLERAQRQGHCHALLESPTGSGKSLALLCATLAWQQHFKSRPVSSPPGPSPNLPTQPPVRPMGIESDNAFAEGGGFIPEATQPGVGAGSEESQHAATGGSNRTEKKSKIPTIFYASRTHSQISQVIREYRKTTYRVPMAVLASRKHYCTNKRVCAKKSVDEECKLLLRDKEQSCPHFKNVHKVKYHSSLQKGGFLEVHDIEDLVKIGHTVKGCSYFAARSMAMEARLVFCPYSYILNPIIRKAMEVDVKGAIVILDEAHNIEDMAREAGSLDVEDKVLDALQLELGQLSLIESVASIYQPLFDMVQGIIYWIGQKSIHLEKCEFEHYCTCWTGNKALRELQAAGISQDCFPILQECALKAIKAASDTESEGVHLTGLSASTLEGLFSSLTYFFSGNGRQAFEYQLGLQRYVKRDEGMAVQGWTHSFSLWCLNPAVVFKEIADASLSVILTSGTLSPMNSFASELGVPFEICMEAPHVINMDSQVWAAAVSAGPGNVSLNASYKTADGYAFQDALGAALEEICKVVPDGALVFFPSYKLMEKLCNRWMATGQWARLNGQKTLFVEPRGNQENFEPILSGYYGAIRGVKKGTVRKLKGGHKRVSKSGSSQEGLQQKSKGGAAFLAVCRGKVSEGIDFADENARAVVVVGIPFPNKKNIQVELKKRYNDENKSSKNLLSGDQWYCHQAFRALNQAVGRCIRHRFDFGAIILLDERFKKVSNLDYMSKWLRNSIRQFDNFDHSVEGLHNFFCKIEDQKMGMIADANNLMVKGCAMSDSDTVTCKENTPASKSNVTSKGVTKNATQKIQDFFSYQLFNQGNAMQIVNNAESSMVKNSCTGDASVIISKEITFASTSNVMSETDTKAVIRKREEASSNSKDHVGVKPNTYTHSKCFRQPPLEEINHNQGCSTSTSFHSSASPICQAKMVQLSSQQNLSEVKTPCPAVKCKDSVIDSGQNSCGSPYLANNAGDLFKERMTPVNFTPSRDLEDDFVPNQYPAISVGMSGNSHCRKRSPSRFQLDSDMKTNLFGSPRALDRETKDDHFGSPSDTNDLSPQCQEEHSMLAKEKGLACHMFENKGLGEKTLVSLRDQCKLSQISSLASVSNLGDTLNYSADRSKALVQNQSMELSGFRAQNLHSDSSVCSPLEGIVEAPHAVSEDGNEKNWFLSCSHCGNSFGLPEKQFIVRCMVTALSKSYFATLLENKLHECLPMENTLQDRSCRTPVIITDIIFIDQLLTRRPDSPRFSSIIQQKSTWVEEDGCVYRALFCPQCEASNACVGVHIMATDVSNVSLLNKVLFFKNCVKLVSPELVAQHEVHKLGTKSCVSNISKIPSIEDYSYNASSKRPRAMTTTRTKLRLPKKY